jgi:hypothetical protein
MVVYSYTVMPSMLTTPTCVPVAPECLYFKLFLRYLWYGHNVFFVHVYRYVWPYQKKGMYHWYHGTRVWLITTAFTCASISCSLHPAHTTRVRTVYSVYHFFYWYSVRTQCTCMYVRTRVPFWYVRSTRVCTVRTYVPMVHVYVVFEIMYYICTCCT